MHTVPSPPKARLMPGEQITHITALDSHLYALTTFGRILQSQPNWTWIEVPGPARGNDDGA